ncbi:hypothetical protein D3C74_465150 [compost metagenome]
MLLLSNCFLIWIKEISLSMAVMPTSLIHSVVAKSWKRKVSVSSVKVYPVVKKAH